MAEGTTSGANWGNVRVVTDSQLNALDHIGQEMRAAFSLLSGKDAEQAVSATLAHLEGGLESDFVKRDCPLHWADIDQAGRYIRGGRCGLLSLYTDIVAQPQDDPVISMIMAFAAKERAVAGDIIPLPREDRFLWFVPVNDSAAKSAERTNLRVICVGSELCEQVIEIYNHRANLTPAEKRTIFQLVGGLSKRQSATRDGVSVETKRAHTKNACAKLGCAGQTELIKKVLGQMVPLVTIGDTDTARVRIASEFVAHHLSKDVRLTVQLLPDGRQIRVIECGPLSGRPVLLIHGMMWPLFLVDLGRHLEAAGLRIIMPIRRGHLEPASAPSLYNQGDFAADFLDCIAAFIRQNFNEPPPVLGNSLGAVLAASFANRHPDLVPHLFLVATNLTQTKEASSPRASRFYGAMNRISQRRQLFQRVTWEYRDYYRNHKTCRDILRKLFEESDSDLSTLEGRHSGRNMYEIFSDSYQTSIAGIAEDFSFVMQGWRIEFEKLNGPVTFIQGTHDPLTRVSDFESVLSGSGRRHTIELIKDGGHFLSNSHPKELWGIIGRQIT
ncbi:alpha/beta fold hydrolase [Hoeflea sp.]|uniref:alpha/beta fold hydrolase n=1 Tax=Hoeflea sp. TaxID=1940281 RepID=UPI003B021023